MGELSQIGAQMWSKVAFTPRARLAA